MTNALCSFILLNLAFLTFAPRQCGEVYRKVYDKFMDGWRA